MQARPNPADAQDPRVGLTAILRHDLCFFFCAMSGARVRLIGVLAAILAAGSARAQLCGPTDDPCVVSSSINVPTGSLFDLGGRDLVIAANTTLTVQTTGLMTILAGNITLNDGARIVANGNDGLGGSLQLQATGAIVLDPNSRVDVSGGSGGDITLMSQTLLMNGQVRANATLRDNEGGILTIQTSGDATIAGGGIQANSGNRFGCGGLMEMISDGSITVTAPIEFRGGDCDGGDVDLDAAGNITIGPASELTVIATYEFGSGGAISLTAGGDVTVDGLLTENGEGSFSEGGGDGGDLDIIGSNVTMNGAVAVNGGAPDGGGGFVDVAATRRLAINGPIDLLGPLQGFGGDVLLWAEEGIDLTSVVTATGGYVGGSFDAVARGSFSMTAAGAVDVTAGGSAFGQYGGTLDIQACNVTVPAGASLIAGGDGPPPRASIRTQVSNATTIGGTLSVGAGIELRYRSVLPILQPGSVLSSVPTVIADPALPCCFACEATTTSTSSSTSSTVTTTTSSTTPTTLETSTTSTTTTTSTTEPPPTTTTSTTEPPPTTTSSTTSSSTTSTAPPTTVTSTSVTTTSSTSSSSTTSSSSVTTTVVSTSTSTTLPLSCLDEPLEGYEAVECVIGSLDDMLASQSEDALGGHKSAKRLAGKIAKTSALVEQSRSSSKAVKLLTKAQKKVLSFQTQISRLLFKAKIADELATELIDLSEELTIRIDDARTPLAN